MTSFYFVFENIEDESSAYAQQQNLETDAFKIITDKDQYEKKTKQITTVQISGEIIGNTRGTPVLLQITDPKENTIELVVKVSKSGTFTVPYLLSDKSPSGEYKILLTYQGKEIKKISFKFLRSFENNQLPKSLINQCHTTLTCC